ncbi:hypothetical protein BV96_01109 [Sphingomonas paucimobilis]|nr:hypothetical protein BV96_01109 [Sphingomonas paucimobilis]
MNTINLETLLADFEQKRTPVVSMLCKGWYPEEDYSKWHGLTPDEWVTKPKIMEKRIKPEFKGITKEMDENCFNQITDMISASIDAAYRYIVARDFNEYREDKWRVLAKVSASR